MLHSTSRREKNSRENGSNPRIWRHRMEKQGKNAFFFLPFLGFLTIPDSAHSLSHGPQIVWKKFLFPKIIKGGNSLFPVPKLCGKIPFFPKLLKWENSLLSVPKSCGKNSFFPFFSRVFTSQFLVFFPLTRVKSQCGPGVRNVKELPRLRGYL